VNHQGPDIPAFDETLSPDTFERVYGSTVVANRFFPQKKPFGNFSRRAPRQARANTQA
jgi:hypothetical protein